MIVAVDHQNDRTFIDRVAALRRDLGLPAFGQKRFKRGDLLLERVGGRAVHRQLFPHHAGRCLQRLGGEPRRFGIGQVGQDQHGRRMLDETIGHLVQGEAHVLETDFLADDIVRHSRKLVVH